MTAFPEGIKNPIDTPSVRSIYIVVYDFELISQVHVSVLAEAKKKNGPNRDSNARPLRYQMTNPNEESYH